MENTADNGSRGPPSDYLSALATAKKLAIEKAKQKRRPALPEVEKPVTETKAVKDTASIQGKKQGNTVKPSSHHNRSGPATVKREPEVESLASSRTQATGSTANQYAGLVCAKKRKRKERTPEPAHRTVASGAEEAQVLPNRPFAPLKKKVRGARPPYENVCLVDTRTTRHSSEWYESIDLKQKYARSDLESLKYMSSLIRSCEAEAKKDGQGELQVILPNLRQRLHHMEFYDFLSGVLVKKSKLLEDGGLPSIFSGNDGVQYPWDIRADSLQLYQKWLAGVIDPHLLRGIETKTNRTANGKETKSRSLQKDYKDRVSCNYVGAGRLQNGRWWPFQICAMRDGAHGEIEGGIHGQPGNGAYSVVVSSGGYSDEDRGGTLKYCGTSGTDGKPSVGTNQLKDSWKRKNPVRVLRSSALPAANPYRPAKGLRYDGLYDVVDYEILDLDTAMHRFTLSRCAGQDPIRCKGVERRPTGEELAEYSKIRALLGLGA